MGYYSTNDRRDGRFRKIEVRLPNKSGLTVRARKGYVAPRGKAPETPRRRAKDGPSPELRDAMESPLPLTGAAAGADRRGVQGAGAERVGRDLDVRRTAARCRSPKSAGMFKNDLEVLGIATDDKGKTFSTDRNTVNLNMKPDTAKRVTATGFRVIQSLELTPGPLQPARGRARSQYAQGRVR